MEERPPHRHRPVARPAPPCVEPILRRDDALPPEMVRRVVTLAPGERCAYRAEDWADALVVVEDGAIELEAESGDRRRLARGAVLWLVGLPLRALHNVGRHPAVIVAVSRRLPDRD